MKMKKRALSIVLTLAMLVTMVPMMGVTANGETTYDRSWYDTAAVGVGASADNPYLIHNTAQLEGLYQIINSWNEGGTSVGGNSTRYDTFTNKYIKLADDFDGSAYMTKAIGHWFDSLTGGVYRTFNGSFDGNGKTVNLSFSGYTTAYIGLFAAIGKNGCVKNLIVNGNNDGDGAVSGASYVGGIAGYLEGSIVNCCVTTNNTCGSGTNACVGGIAGYAKNESSICNCYFAGRLGSSGGNGDCGWFIGKGEGGSTVNNSYYYNNAENVKGNCATGSCTATDCVGINNSDQMKAASGAQNDEWDQLPILSNQRKALVDALNAYVNNNSTGGYYAWTVNAEANGGYPSFADGVCKIGNTKYATIAEALAAVKTNTLTTITLLQDCTANLEINNDINIKIDLRGHTITASDTEKTVIENNGTLTITDSVAGGKVTGGTYGVDQKGTLNLVGKANVSNIYLSNGKVIKVDESYTGASTVSVQTPPDTTEGSVAITTENSKNFVGNISSHDVKFYTNDVVSGENHTIKLLKSDTSWYNNSAGSSDNPYIIQNTAQLEGLASVVNGGNYLNGKYVKLADDFYDTKPLTTPIGGRNSYFYGTFDGNNKNVNLYMNYPSSDRVGMFGYVGSCGEIINVSTSGFVIGNQHVGGVVGEIYGKVNNCKGACDVKGILRVGGIVGGNLSFASYTISDCVSSGKVKGNVAVGGVAGYAYNANITKCEFAGEFESIVLEDNLVGNEFGGIVGNLTYYSVLSNCYSTGSVSGLGSVGGIAGSNNNNSTIKNCFSTGNVAGNNDCVGGICGKNSYYSIIGNCYATGTVSGVSDVGGVVGANYESNINNCFSTGSVSSQNASVGGIVGLISSGSVTNSYFNSSNNNSLQAFGLSDGEYTIKYNYGLPETQMKASSVMSGGEGWESITVGNESGKPGKAALVYALNAYVKNYPAENYLSWGVTGSNYPQLIKSVTVGSGGADYTTISAALAGVTDGTQTLITLTEDIAENISINSGQNIIIDLNNHDLKGTGKGSVINNNGTLTIMDSTLGSENPSATTRYFIDNKCRHGKTIGTGTGEACTDCSGNWATADSCFETLYTGEGKPSGNEGEHYITVKGGCITGGNATNGGGINNTGTLTIESGNVCGNLATNGGGVYNSGTFNLKAGHIIGNYGDNGGGVYGKPDATPGSTVVITGGSIERNGASSYGGVYLPDNGSITLGGKPVIKNNKTLINVISNLVVDSGTVAINSTTPLKDGSEIHVLLLISTYKKEITGLTSDNSKFFVTDREGYKFKFAAGQGGGNNSLEDVEIIACKIGEKNYKTIQEAINDNSQSTDPTTITLLEDTTENITIPSGRNIVLDLKGKKLSANSGAVITNEGTLTITDTTTEGTPGSLGGGTGVKGVEQKSGTLTLAGKAKINNIYLHEGQTIKVDSGFSGGATVSTKNAPVNGTPVNVTSGENSSDFSGKITAFNNTDYKIYNTGSGNNQKLILSVHEHTWNYSVGTTTTTNDTLKAYCSETFGTTHCSYNTEANAQKVTIIKPALTTYGGAVSEKATLSGKTLGALTLADNSIKYIGISGTEYSESTAAPTAAGKYKASITVGSGEDAKTAYVEYTIAAAPSTITTTPTAVSNLSYDKDNPQPQPLINAGQVEHGTIYYALGDNSTNAPTGEGAWSTDVPTATDAGTYYVWYKVVGDENYADTTPTCIMVKISSEKDCWLLNLIKKIFSCKCLTTISTRLIDRFNSIFKNIFK